MTTSSGNESIHNTWGRWATLGLGLSAVLAGQIAALTPFACWHGLDVAHWPDFARDGVAAIWLICVSTPVQVAVLMLFARAKDASAARYLGLEPPPKRDAARGIITVLVFIIVIDGSSWLLGHRVVTPFQINLYNSASAAGWLPLLWLTLVVVAPIGEEILFRGFLFRGWHRSPRDAWWVIGVIALLWAIIHVQYDLFIIGQVFVFGLILGWARWSSNSTTLTILLHSLVNGLGTIETLMALQS
jgi:membrane protease YdiL (CAAX protease family)